MRIFGELGWAIHTNTALVFAGRQHTVSLQPLGNLSRPQAADAHLENPPYYLRRWLVHDPLVPVPRVFLVAKRDVGGQGYSGIATALHDTANLVAGIFCVPFVEKVLHWHDVTDPVGGVDVVHNGDVPHVQPDKIFFQKLPHHKTVAPQPGVVFHNEVCHKPLFGQLHDFHESRTGERNA